RACRPVQKVLFLSPAGLHAFIPTFPRSRQTQRRGHRVEHRRLAQGLQGNLPESAHRRTRGGNGCADYLRLGCACSRRSGGELRGSGGAGPQRWVYALLPVHEAAAADGKDLNSFSFPTTTLVGPGALAELPARLKRLGLERPLVVTDAGLL